MIPEISLGEQIDKAQAKSIFDKSYKSSMCQMQSLRQIATTWATGVRNLDGGNCSTRSHLATEVDFYEIDETKVPELLTYMSLQS